MNKWKFTAESLDMGWQYGLCVGKYDATGKSIIRDAIRVNVHAPAEEVAKKLRLLADSVEKNMKD